MASKATEVSSRTPPFDPDKQLPHPGHGRISGERFFSVDWMTQEWARMWRRVWNMAFRESDIPEAGDSFVYELGKESFVFVRGGDGVIRGFYNVCQHRGNQLALGGEGCGHMESFHCGYHGWEWGLDGVLKNIPDVETYPQFADGIPSDELGLAPVQVDSWGGWVWFNMDPDCEPLSEFLGVMPEHLDPYGLEDWAIIEHKTFEWPCNWKVACDAFNETYHFRTLHPQMMQWADGRADIDLLGIHSRMINRYATVDRQFPDQENINPGLRTFMEKIYRIDPETYEGKPADVRLELQRRKRATQDDTHLPYKNLHDEQLSDTFHYTFFPNVSWNVTAESIIGFRYRPHPSDPARCYYDLIVMRCMRPGEPRPDYEHRCFSLDELPARYNDVLDINAEDVVIDPLDQDSAAAGPVQRGLSSDGFKGMVLCDQEARVGLFHAVLDDYLEGRR